MEETVLRRRQQRRGTRAPAPAWRPRLRRWATTGPSTSRPSRPCGPSRRRAVCTSTASADPRRGGADGELVSARRPAALPPPTDAAGRRRRRTPAAPERARFRRGREDGILGPETEAAIRLFQRERRSRDRRRVRSGDHRRARTHGNAGRRIGRTGPRAGSLARDDRPLRGPSAASSSSTRSCRCWAVALRGACGKSVRSSLDLDRGHARPGRRGESVRRRHLPSRSVPGPMPEPAVRTSPPNTSDPRPASPSQRNSAPRWRRC